MSEKPQTDRNSVAKIQEQKNHLSQRLRVLVIDDNAVCLEVLAFNLKKCGYRVSTTRDAREAIEMLKKNKDSFDVVLTDVVRSDVDGFEIVKIIGYEIGIPVIMTSANSDIEIIEKGVRHGAIDFLVKPVRVEILKNIWQHVVRKSMHFSKGVKKIEDDGASENLNKNSAAGKDESQSTCSTEENENSKKSSGNSKKRSRAEWTHELRAKFADVVRRLEVNDKVVPKNILKMMNVPNLTRQQVASYLQKFRINEEQQNVEQREKLRRLSESAMYSLTQSSGPFPSVYPISQPHRHQSLMPSIQYSNPNMISQGNSNHVSYNPMEIHPQALNLPSPFGVSAPSSGVDGISNWQNDVGIKMEQPYASHSRSTFTGNGHQIGGGFTSQGTSAIGGFTSQGTIGGFTSQGTSYIQPNNNVGSTQGFTSQGASVILPNSNVGSLQGLTSQRTSVILPSNNIGSTQMKSELVPAAKVHTLVSNVGSNPNYLPVPYEQRKSLVAMDPQLGAIRTDFSGGLIQTPNESVTFKSEENISNVFNQANIFDEDNFRVPSDDLLNELDAVMQSFSDHAPTLCDEALHWE